jgi:hypothetical protein|eukprot:SAG25_NODE_834_length_5144_cov_2.081269_2_plen_168_part_00
MCLRSHVYHRHSQRPQQNYQSSRAPRVTHFQARWLVLGFCRRVVEMSLLPPSAVTGVVLWETAHRGHGTRTEPAFSRTTRNPVKANQTKALSAACTLGQYATPNSSHRCVQPERRAHCVAILRYVHVIMIHTPSHHRLQPQSHWCQRARHRTTSIAFATHRSLLKSV